MRSNQSTYQSKPSFPVFLIRHLLTFCLILIPLISQAQWPVTPEEALPVSIEQYNQMYPASYLFADGNVFVAWFHNESSIDDYRLMYQILDQQSLMILPPEGIPISGSGFMTVPTWWIQLVPSDSNSVIIVYSDGRTGDMDYLDVYAQKINSLGERQWGSDGIPLCVDPLNELRPHDAVTDSAGGAFALIASSDNNNGMLYMQRVTADGEILWGDQGVLFRDGVGYGSWGQIAPDLQGGVFAAWTELNPMGAIQQLNIQHLDAEGNSLLAWNGISFRRAGGSDRHTYVTQALSDGEGGVMWFMPYTGLSANTELEFVRTDFNANLVWELSDIAPVWYRQNIDMLYNPSDGHYWAVSKADQGYEDAGHPYVYRLDVNGNLSIQDLQIGNDHYDQWTVDFTSYNDGIIVAYTDNRDLYPYDDDLLYVQKVDVFGNLLFGGQDGFLASVIDLTGLFSPGFHSVNCCPDGFNGSIVVTQDRRDYSYHDIFARRVLFDGTLGGLAVVEPVISILGNDIFLQWEPIEPATSYNIYKSTDPYVFSPEPDTTVTGTVFTDTNAVNEISQYYRVTWQPG